jgi:hypothetical protein
MACQELIKAFKVAWMIQITANGACLPSGSGRGSARSINSVWRFAVVQRSILLACLYVWLIMLALKRRLSVHLGLQHGCWLSFAFTDTNMPNFIFTLKRS